jgi:methionine synthase II (cobalamin-independent)
VVRLEDGRPLSAAPDIEAAVQKLVLARALAMVRALRETGAQPILFLDEPGLYAFDRKDPQHLVALQELRIVLLALRKEGALVGIHCCSNTDWQALLGLEIDVLSLDARLSLGSLLANRAAFDAFVAAGRRLAIGVVPTNLDAAYDVGVLVDAVRATLEEHLGPQGSAAVLGKAWLSPACGLALRTVSDAERVFAELDEARALLRESGA